MTLKDFTFHNSDRFMDLLSNYGEVMTISLLVVTYIIGIIIMEVQISKDKCPRNELDFLESVIEYFRFSLIASVAIMISTPLLLAFIDFIPIFMIVSLIIGGGLSIIWAIRSVVRSHLVNKREVKEQID